MLKIVDASNVLNSINRKVVLHKIHYICAPLAKYIHNCYLLPSRLFIAGGGEISSSEDTTQGVHMLSGWHNTALLPVHDNTSLDAHTKQIAFAEVLVAGRLTDITN